MNTDFPQKNDEKASVASAIQEITEKTRLLVKDEIELAKAEVQLKVKALGVGAGIAAAAGIFVLGALVMLLFGFAWLAWYLLPVNNQSIYVGFFFVAGVLLIMAAIAGLVAKRFLTKGSPPTPAMAIDEGKKIQETVNEARAAEVKR
ncbi:MAG: phage holin family protein [Solirubrobacterales bacterium]|nr:phage holin family protein [Solirubrobacterales bacterium]